LETFILGFLIVTSISISGLSEVNDLPEIIELLEAGSKY